MAAEPSTTDWNGVMHEIEAVNRIYHIKSVNILVEIINSFEFLNEIVANEWEDGEITGINWKENVNVGNVGLLDS